MKILLEEDEAPTQEGCYNIVSLDRETQNGEETTKPVFRKTELGRFCCDFGIFPDEATKRMAAGHVDPRELETEFSRVIGNNFHEADPNSLNIVSLFGKQEGVKQQLQQLKCWSKGLTGNGQGIFCLRTEISHNGEYGLVVFVWLQDEYFTSSTLRDTATYMLRFLSSMSHSIICCLTADDIKLLREDEERLAAENNKSDQLLNFSASFRVKRQDDCGDCVSCSLESTNPILLDSKDNVRLIGGIFVGAIRHYRKASESKSVYFDEKFFRKSSFYTRLKEFSQEYSLDLRPVLKKLDYDDEVNMLKEFGRWPSKDMEILKDQMSVAHSIENLLEEAKKAMENELFALSATKSDLLKFYEEFVTRIENQAAYQTADAEVLGGMASPFKFRDCVGELFAAFKAGDTNELNRIMMFIAGPRFDEDAHFLNRSMTNLDAVWGEAESDEEFQSYLLEHLAVVKSSWLVHIGTFLEKANLKTKREFAYEESKKLEAVRNHEHHLLVEKQFNALVEQLRSDRKILLEVVDLRRWALGPIITVSMHRQTNSRPTAMLDVYKYDVTAVTSLPYLGRVCLPVDVELLAVYTVRPLAVLLITKKQNKTSIGVHEITNFNRKLSYIEVEKEASLCSFDIESRVLAILYDANTDRIGKIALYRFSESYTSMERAGAFDLSVKTSLDYPVTDITIIKNEIYITGKDGATQAINMRTHVTSKRIMLKQDGRKSSLLPVNSDCALMYLRLANVRSGGYTPIFSSVAQDGHRSLPDCTVNSTSIVGDEVDVSYSGATVYVLDKLAQTIYTFNTSVTVHSDSYTIEPSTGAAYGDSTTRFELQHWLRSFYHLFDKYPVQGALERVKPWKARFCMTLSIQGVIDTADEELMRTGQSFFDRMQYDLEALNKPLPNVDLKRNISLRRAYPCSNWVYEQMRMASALPVYEFLVHAITFVGVQICRAEKNALTILSDVEQEMSLNQSVLIDAATIARDIQFGLQSTLLEAWTGRCVVISSMGKQSTGKSYFLNHLTGTSFAMSGMRCTDGAWMSMQILDGGILLVVLDFEGLGSFERSVQEDIFLSVLNSSVSRFTIYRIEMRYDKDADKMFNKFQKGMRLIKGDNRLFRGKLFMSVKDVNPSDANDVVIEFWRKLQNIVRQNGDANFITEMYGEDLDINCSPPLGTTLYNDALQHAARVVSSKFIEKGDAGYTNGKEFLDCLRLVLAKLSILDWTSIDEDALKMKRTEVSRLLPGIVRTGCRIPQQMLDDADIAVHMKDKLVLEGTGVVVGVSLAELCARVPSHAEKWEELHARTFFEHAIADEEIDFGINMNSSGSDFDSKRQQNQTLAWLHSAFTGLLKVHEYPDYLYTSATQKDFDTYLSFLVHRRIARVELWSAAVMQCKEWSMWQQQLLGRFEELMKRCQNQCVQCKLGCMKLLSHKDDHNCTTDHCCKGVCKYCQLNVAHDQVPFCAKEAGHEGICECNVGNHTCGKPCDFINAPNCEKKCGQKQNHMGQHHCSVGKHACGTKCSADNCDDRCIFDFELQHTVHKCALSRCLHQCSMEDCERSCSHEDHFHGQTDTLVAYSAERSAGSKGVIHDATSAIPVRHMCDGSHKCPMPCEVEGTCMRNMQIKKSTRTFAGKHGKFDYAYKEMIATRKNCASILQPGEFGHLGAHSCIEDGDGSAADASHSCDARCPCCDYLCDEEVGHAGMHTTSHGNMKNTVFIGEEKQIDIDGRVYDRGEAGVAEMCNVYCSKMGRGHVHYLKCDGNSATCTYSGHTDQRKHYVKGREGTLNMSMDEVLHGKYWETIGWQDPCPSANDQEEFDKCPFKCEMDHSDDSPSYCTLKAFHEPSSSAMNADGHEFACKHVTDGGSYHHVFVLDSSGSMSGQPWQDLMAAYHEYVVNRFSDIDATSDVVSVITFDNKGSIVYENKPIHGMRRVNVPFRGGGTSYSTGLRLATEVLSRSNYSVHKPAVIFFSDGQANDPEAGAAMATHLGKRYGPLGLRAFAVAFGHARLDTLELVASNMGGSYLSAVVGNELKATFRKISMSLGSRAGLFAIDYGLCPICQHGSDLEVSLRCQHRLHTRCYEALRLRIGSDNVACPICRAEE